MSLRGTGLAHADAVRAAKQSVRLFARAVWYLVTFNHVEGMSSSFSRGVSHSVLGLPLGL